MDHVRAEDIPSIDDLVERARALTANIAGRAIQTESDRRVPIESIEELKSAGLCRLYTPRKFGGYANGFGPALPVVAEISKACMSTGWVFGFINFHAWIIALYSEEAQDEVWSEGPDTYVSTSFAPMLKAIPVEGGFRVSGTSPWSSGIHHSRWIAAGGITENEAGERVHRMFLIPRKEYVIKDDWYNMGLRGSGSNSAVFDDVFVPSHRALLFSDLVEASGPGAASCGHPMFTTPFVMGVEGLICAPVIGAAMGAYENYRDWTREKVATFGGHSVAGSTEAQRRLSEAAGDIESAYVVLQVAFARADAGGPYSMLDRARNRRNWAWVALTAQRGVDGLMQAGGARVLFDTHPVQRAWRDIHAITPHLALNPYSAAINFGRLELGLDPDPLDALR